MVKNSEAIIMKVPIQRGQAACALNPQLPEGFRESSYTEEETLKFHITSCSLCLCNSACSLQSLDHIGHVVLESGGLTILQTGAYLTHSCPALSSPCTPA